MSIDPTFQDQQVLADTRRRGHERMPAREKTVELMIGVGFAAAVVGLWLLDPPNGFSVLPALVSGAVLVLATQVRFDTPFGYTVPTQLAFVPLLFAVPLPVVPIVVALALMVARLPEVFRRETVPSRPLLAIGSSWFAIGPPLVFELATTSPQRAGASLLIGALAAQFALDFCVSTLRYMLDRGATFATQLRESWVYGIDAALSGVALAVAKEIHSAPLAALALVPLLGVFASFAHERRHRLRSLLELNNAYRGTALLLGDVIETDDNYTGEHSRAIVTLCLQVARDLGLNAGERRNLEFAALLHDVGKIAIPKEIINKPDKLDPDEWTIIKTHTIEGQRMLDRVGGFMHEVGLIVRSHHERWDGTGYPDGLAGDAIPIESRIITCCDTWNAMRTDRSYRKALPYDVAMTELLSCSGSQFDPRVATILAEIVASAESHEPEFAEPSANALGVPATAGEGEEPPSGESVLSPPAQAEQAAHREPLLEDARSADPVERLLEDSWRSRAQRAKPRELTVEAILSGLFLAVAISMAVAPIAHGRVPLGLTALLVGLYAVISRCVRFPLGAGSVVPSYLVLVPMLLLLPPGAVPLLAAGGLTLGTAAKLVAGRGSLEEPLFAVPNAWHAVGPAGLLLLAGPVNGLARAGVYLGALMAGFVVDLVISVVRESVGQGVAPRLQGRVIATVWLVDLSLAPFGFLVAQGARENSAWLLLLLPLVALFAVVSRDRRARIAEAERRLGLVAHERTRLQAAVHRLGDAFAAKLDLGALTDVLLAGSVDASDADGGRLMLHASPNTAVLERSGSEDLEPALQAASEAAQRSGRTRQVELDGVWAIALPLMFGGDGAGALAVARRGREFREDEEALMRGLADRAQQAATEILEHETLREQAVTDPLTRLGNRRRLSDDLAERLAKSSSEAPLLLMLFDLDGFKNYNDTFGHVAGDALLARLGHKLAAAVSPHGTAYRLGGDEFCALLPARRDQLHDAVAATAAALEEHGEKFSISASCGTVLLPHEARTVDYALQLADERMYARKQGRPSGAGAQAHDVLIHIMRAKQPDLADRSSGVAKLAVTIGRRLSMSSEQLDELARAATLRDIGTVGLPDAILTKPGPLDMEELSFVRQHTVLGERILSAAPALRPVAAIVRASHERWDGRGYPDGLEAENIPLAARIVAVCEAYEAMTSERCYRAARSVDDARRELQREAGHQFDPTVVSAFLRELDELDSQGHTGLGRTAAAHRADLAADVMSQVDELMQSPTG
jgi:diguanylate cyclase (GGDEF)-like protein/putative nucleotidyltransferase with HDIG domain